MFCADEGSFLSEFNCLKRSVCRGVAQSGSAPVLGTGGREFESRRPDHFLVRIYDCGCLVVALALQYFDDSISWYKFFLPTTRFSVIIFY